MDEAGMGDLVYSKFERIPGFDPCKRQKEMEEQVALLAAYE